MINYFYFYFVYFTNFNSLCILIKFNTIIKGSLYISSNFVISPSVNRIDEIAKRAPGIEFKMDGLKLTFEYSARPIGGVNPKAAILDILANFLTIGSVSAMFWGGQHRFMGKSVKYPFMGGIS